METVFLKLTSAIVVAGDVVKPPAVVEVTRREARDLLNRGKAVLATEKDGAPVVRSETREAPLHPDIQAHEDDRAEQKREHEAELQAEAEALASAGESGADPHSHVASDEAEAGGTGKNVPPAKAGDAAKPSAGRRGRPRKQESKQSA